LAVYVGVGGFPVNRSTNQFISAANLAAESGARAAPGTWIQYSRAPGFPFSSDIFRNDGTTVDPEPSIRWQPEQFRM
jgi:hypothetical protein